MFNENDYNENVEYCKYVFDENKRLRLELDNNEIQVVANLYVDELVDNDIDPYESIVKNELMLLDTVDFYKLEIKEEKISINDKKYQNAYIEHIKCLKELLNGVENIAVATDDMTYYKTNKKYYKHFNVFKQEQMNKKLQKLLLKNGFSREEIEKILCKNAQRFFNID